MPARKLPDEKLEAIKQALRDTTDSHAQIAERLSVSTGAISKVRARFKISRPICSVSNGEIDDKYVALENKIISLKDERNKYKKAYELVQKDSSLFQLLAEEIRGSVEPVKPLPDAPKIDYDGHRIKESLVLHLSDEHATDVIEPHQVGNLERYNFGIALRRAEVLVDSVIKFSKKTLKNYDFPVLYIFANGDHVSGEIHSAVDASEYKNILKNCLAVGQMHALMLRDLSPWFEAIKIIYTSGNHGRRSIKKNYFGPHDNFDYLVSQVAFAYARDLVNVEFIVPDSFSINLDIEGHGFHIAHGDDVRAWSGLPWYGIERTTRRLMALNCQRNKIDYFCFGHFHQPASQTVLSGEMIINGTWVATSPYVYNSLSSYIEPTQLLHGVHKDFGISWRLPIRLRSEGEHMGPKRYSVLLK